MWEAATNRILVVCHANLIRSAMGAAMLRAAAGASGVAVEVRSAGVRAQAGRPMLPEAAEALARRGFDTTHASRRVELREAREADVVVAMARAQLRELVADDPTLFRSTFTLKELVRRAEQAGPRRPGEDWPAWLARVGAGRSAGSLLGDTPADDVADPIGKPAEAYERCADELRSLVTRLVSLALPV